jgi:RHS repeat-associated protein
VYVSNETPNIPVYFDNLQVSHVRSPLLETSEYYPYGLKMANISYRAASTLTNRYGWNGGNEYEDEGELNYSNTFYRKYDAQIGRFTGVDIRAEEAMFINPYQFGYNNPVMFNDPNGDLSSADWNDLLSRLGNGSNLNGFGEFGGYYSEGGGGGFHAFTSHSEAFGWGLGQMNASNGWGAYPGWATSAREALGRFSSSGGSSSGTKGFNYVNASLSGAFS